jgi:enoyl-CoA hydratase/carnithine racemase
MAYKTIKVINQNSIAILQLANEEKLNALSQLFFDEFDEALEQIRQDDNCKVLIIKGTEKVFSAGGDLKEIGSAGYDKALLMCTRVQKSLEVLQNIEIPVIAAMQGIVFGGGFELALHCDVRFCTPDTIFRLPESDLGLIPGAGGISVFSRIFSPADAAYYLFTGNQIPVKDALNKGFVQDVFQNVEFNDKVLEFSQSLCGKSSESLAAIKKLLIMNIYEELDECLINEAREFSSVLQKSGKVKIEDFFKNKNKSK